MHRFKFKSGQIQLFLISWVDHAHETVVVLERDEVGVAGHDGRRIPFADLESVYAEDKPGVFLENDEQIAAWRRWARNR